MPKVTSSTFSLFTAIHCFFFLIFNRSLLEYNCFTILCQLMLRNKANQPYAYTCPHIPSLLSLLPLLPIPLLQVIAKHRAHLPVLCCCFPSANYFTFGSVIYVDATLTSPQLCPPTPCPQVHFLCLTLYSCPATMFISTIFFLDSIHMCQHTVFVFLFLTYFTLYDRLQVHPPHYK